MRRGENEDATARLEHAAQLSQRADVVVEMLEDVERCHEVEGARRERQVHDICVAHVAEPSLATELQSLVGDVDAFGRAEAAKLLEHEPGSAPGIEDLQVGAAGISLPDPIEDLGKAEFVALH